MASTPIWRFILAALLVLEMWASQATSRTSTDTSMAERYEAWMAQYGRSYKDDAEKASRFEIFKENVEYIESFNEAAAKPYKLAVNKFADLTNEEFQASRTGYRMGSRSESSKLSSFKYADVTEVPANMDWRQKGAVTDIKDQGQCGCCWAFSAVAATEGINQLTTGQLISLSEQELVDCDRSEYNNGCNGGFMEKAFEFIFSNNGLTTEANYPYEGTDQWTCNTEKESPNVAKITGYEDVPANSESSLLNAVANQPVSVAIDNSNFQFYKGGVFTGECGTKLNHAVTAVGYGTTSDGIKYWLVKNSWGTGWGENGYMRIQRDIDAAEGLCGIAMRASYPTA